MKIQPVVGVITAPLLRINVGDNANPRILLLHVPNILQA
jgi:hypothetical protein